MIALVSPVPAAIAEDSIADRIRLSASVGYEYDDNVNDPNVDQSAEQGASAGVFEASIAIDAFDHEPWSLDLGYDFFESIYAEDDVDELDLRLHAPWAQVTRRYDTVDLDFEWRSTFGELGEERYLDTHAFGPTVGTLVGDSVYVSAGYRYEYRNARRAHPLVTAANDRTGHRNGLRADGLLLLPDSGIKLGAGGFLRHQDATETPLFDHVAYGARVRFDWATPFVGVGHGPLELQTRFRYEERRYDGGSRVRTGAGPRRDDRINLTVALELPLHRYAFARLAYDRFSSESNDPAADYASNVARLQLELRN